MRKINLLGYLAIVCLCMAGCSNSEAESVKVEVQEAVIENITEDVINITTDVGEKIEIDTNLESTQVVIEEDGSTTYTKEDGTSVNVKEDGTATVTSAPEPETTQKPTETKPAEKVQKSNKTEANSSKEPVTIHAHAYTFNITKEATCMTKGEKTYTCICGDSYKEDIEKTLHVSGDWTVTKNPSCKETGTKVMNCTVCGTQMQTIEVEKTAHTPGDWTVTQAATCSTNGTQVKTCMVCGVETASETIATNGTHSYYWDGNDTMRTHRCSGCSYTGVTEYNINGAWGYFDDNSAAELWSKVNAQRNATETLERDPEGNSIQIINVQSLIQSSELMALAKTRAAEAAKNFSHGSYSNECLAWGQATATEAKSAWVASSSHRNAMTNPDYTQGGVAVFYFDSNNSGINLTPIYCLELGY